MLLTSLAARRKVPALVGFVLLFLGSRLLYLVLIHPDRLLVLGGYELSRGTIAQEIVAGLKMPFVDYRSDNHSGGSLVVGALASPFFRLLGPTVLALKWKLSSGWNATVWDNSRRPPETTASGSQRLTGSPRTVSVRAGGLPLASSRPPMVPQPPGHTVPADVSTA